jgi:hypothetical protein
MNCPVCEHGTDGADLSLAPRWIARRGEKAKLSVILFVVAWHPTIVP